MRPRVILLLVAASLALGACMSAGDNGPAVLTVQNRSDVTIVDIRISAAANPSFGANLLGGETLAPGDELALGVGCGVLDARVTDVSGTECDLKAVNFCANNALWVITNQTCPVFAATGSPRGGQETP